ncbi:MAG: recombinase family protein [Paracoccaceae bacterium]
MAEKIRRCAVYTRKSTEDGLEQEFNSFDAQYEACAAYALSQRHEGWILNEERYDDGGFSGGNMERPGMKRLLADVAAGKIEIILLYKIDRLTRSLADFSKIVEVLDKAEASFVSITQSFNTTTSMGRLTLNMLLSFAQFEREVTGERIRDKIAVSKRKGIWMGGQVPLGYKVKDRKLVVVPKEAEQVRHIMERYIALGTVPALIEELKRGGYRTKLQQRSSGPYKGGCVYRRGTIYHLLSNRIYRGMIVHKGEAFEGEHEAIVDQKLWNQVQATRAGRITGSSKRKHINEPSLLIGLLEDQYGRPMMPSHSGKSRKAQRYRYYVTRPDALDGKSACRVSAINLENIACEQLAAKLCDDGFLLDLLGDDISEAGLLQKVREQADLASAQLRSGTAASKAELLAKLMQSIRLGEKAVEIALSGDGLARTFGLVEGVLASDKLSLTIPAVRHRSGHQLKLVVPSSKQMEAEPAKHDMKLIALLAEAMEARDLVFANPEMSMNAWPSGRGDVGLGLLNLSVCRASRLN